MAAGLICAGRKSAHRSALTARGETSRAKESLNVQWPTCVGARTTTRRCRCSTCCAITLAARPPLRRGLGQSGSCTGHIDGAALRSRPHHFRRSTQAKHVATARKPRCHRKNRNPVQTAFSDVQPRSCGYARWHHHQSTARIWPPAKFKIRRRAARWDVTFMPVDEERKKFVDFGNAYHLLQSTYLVAPGSKLAKVEDTNGPEYASAASRIPQPSAPLSAPRRRRLSSPCPALTPRSPP